MPLIWKGLGDNLARHRQPGLRLDMLGKSGSRQLSTENFDGSCAVGDPYCVEMTAYSDSSCTRLLPGINRLSAPVAECDETCNGQCYSEDETGVYGQSFCKHGKYAMKAECNSMTCQDCKMEVELQDLPTECLGPLKTPANLSFYAVFDGEIPLPGQSVPLLCMFFY